MMRVDLSNRTSHFLEASGVPWPPYQRDFIEFPILTSSVDPELRDLIFDYGSIEINGEIFCRSIYVVKELTDKYIIDTLTETVSLSDYKNTYKHLKKVGITEDNSVFLTHLSRNEQLKEFSNVVFFEWMAWEMSIRWYNEIFTYLPYKKSDVERLKSYKKPHKFLCLNGSVKDFRLMLVDYLHRKGYDKHGLVSLLVPDPEPINSWEENYEECRNNPRSFPLDGTIKYPYKFDKEYFSNAPFLLDTIEDIPDSGLHNWKPNKKIWKDESFCDNRSVPRKFIEDTYFGIHPETAFFSSNGKYSHRQSAISEKTCRFLLFQPFIVVGIPNMLDIAKDLGFKTFNPIIDESYNNIENDNDRFFKILSVIDDLMSKSMEELHEIYVESLPTIIYNQNVVRDMNPNVLLDKLFDRILRV